ncbi:hypothetical protein [Microbacterium invictum]|uniref:Uncharacterized protein n=1 Tax=Microbacterium invictum TaxID=515415 RepID=A0AA40SML8_9MICO|nr:MULTISPECIES: hypothetical protein [Microbacterium]MBB4139030.1 hypothetical protein [Microbacterium invictum]
MTVISIPVTTSVRPTRVETVMLRTVTAVGGYIASRMARRAARLDVRVAQDAVVEHARDAASARALGLYPR